MLPPPLTRPPGPSPTVNVPSAAPSLAPSFVTVLSPRFATQIPEGSASTATGWLPTETAASGWPFLARTRVTELPNCDATHSEVPSKASASAPPPGLASSGTSRTAGTPVEPDAWPGGCGVGATSSQLPAFTEDAGKRPGLDARAATSATSASPAERSGFGLGLWLGLG